MSGGAADGSALMAKATTTLKSARTLAEQDPDSAFVLAYDAARTAGTALPIQQGLRPTSKGGHYVVDRALRAQFGSGFRNFGAIRRRRNELEYPERPGDGSSLDETFECIATAQEILESAEKLIGELRLFGRD
ncbi:hypothetical protein GCM10022223_41520 [Kineosporia mesophila]|uniref:HEPN domain-containing protein n=1 Tax=Kineosporia mesophila TaxID=566012 RepID=A0ABP6ZYL9_9ACTN|nr:hypothetical protein [Kineosporia mesophila]MCD5348767.1 hypothetical protein [Kineosporia mesophila]